MASIVKNTWLNKTEKRFYKPFIEENYSDKIARIWSKRNKDHGNYGHNNAQILADYDTIDCQDHCQLSHVLAGGQYSKLASKLTSTTSSSSPQHSTYPEKRSSSKYCTFSNCTF